MFRDNHGPSRNVDVSIDLSVSLKKAISAEETAPKRKHVRSCIVYTWDHHSSQQFWAALKVLPLLADEVQTFKAMIVVHKVIQEGAPVTLKEAQKQTGWLETCARAVPGDGAKGYGTLIQGYVEYLVAKLLFHRYHPEFNGTFEYEEYVTLKNINDPNEGYEVITELMNLQDQLDTFQKSIFSHFKGGAANECKISALVPLVHESYGIYKFITSMIRAMHRTTSEEALEPLRSRYNTQHRRLLKFYYECSNLRYLTNLIAIPKLPQDSPNLIESDDAGPSLPPRPKTPASAMSPQSTKTPQAEPEAINDFWSNQHQADYEAQQQRLAQEHEVQMRRQQELAMQQQTEFERLQQQQAEQQRLAQEQLLQQQYTQHTQGKLAELEQQLLAMQGQYNSDQLMLEQYDNRVKMLETELQQISQNGNLQSQVKDEQMRVLQQQVTQWKQKYEALAKLYTQLRQEHMDLLAKYKIAQLKASSAQEAIDRKEKMEKDMKNKNLDLADMIRERDRARLELDRLKSTGRDELEKVERELRASLEGQRNSDNSREISRLLDSTKQLQLKLDETYAALKDKNREIENVIRDKDDELEIYRTGMDETLLKLNDLQLANGGEEEALNEQIDQLILGHLEKLNEIIDAVLVSAARRIDNSLYDLDNPMQAGNQNSTPEYLLSVLENGSSSANEYATSFNNFLADGPNAEQSEIIEAVNMFASAVQDIMSNAKGAFRLTANEAASDKFLNATKAAAAAAKAFFLDLQSTRLKDASIDQKTDVVITSNVRVQQEFQRLTKIVESLAPANAFDILARSNEDIGDLVDRELGNAASVIDAAAARLQALLDRPRQAGFTSTELQIHESLLDAAVAITQAVGQLLRAATDSQREIVQEGKGSSSRTAFYKRNNRWTEGLISAAKAVANATNVLIETADGVISGKNSPEQLIVASNDVAASTAQLVAASRVKQSFMSKTQDALESASKKVNTACRNLVRQVQIIVSQRLREKDDYVDYEALGAHEFKVREMEQKVEILKLENELANARRKLGDMRKISYHQDTL